MDAEDDQATDEEVFVDLETALGDFPHLKAIMPATYPRAPRFKISRNAMKSYSDARANRFWHNLNLPLLLHSYRHNPDSRARELFKSLLKTLDDFADRLGHLQGARSLLSPLWDDPWTGTPQLWSIAGCAYVALCYLAAKIEIIGFETPISGTLKDDITVRLAGKITHVEVESRRERRMDSVEPSWNHTSRRPEIRPSLAIERLAHPLSKQIQPAPNSNQPGLTKVAAPILGQNGLFNVI